MDTVTAPLYTRKNLLRRSPSPAQAGKLPPIFGVDQSADDLDGSMDETAQSMVREQMLEDQRQLEETKTRVWMLRQEYNRSKTEREMLEASKLTKVEAFQSLRADTYSKVEFDSINEVFDSYDDRVQMINTEYDYECRYKKTLNLILYRINAQKTANDIKMQKLQKELKERREQVYTLIRLSRDFKRAQKLKQQELMEYFDLLVMAKENRDSLLKEKKGAVRKLHSYKLKKERDERERQAAHRDAMKEMNISNQLKKRLATQNISNNVTEKEEQQVAEKLDEYEEAFMKIRRATGLGDPDEVVLKFLNREKTTSDLHEQYRSAQKRMDGLLEEKLEQEQKLSHMKYGSLSDEYEMLNKMSSDVESCQKRLHRANVRFLKAIKLVLNIKIGIGALVDKLDEINIQGVEAFPQQDVMDSNIAEFLARIEQRLVKLQVIAAQKLTTTKAWEQMTPSSKGRMSEARKLKEFMYLHNTQLAKEQSARVENIRVLFQDGYDDDDEEDTYRRDDESEAALTYRGAKVQALQAMEEKAKGRRGKRTSTGPGRRPSTYPEEEKDNLMRPKGKQNNQTMDISNDLIASMVMTSAKDPGKFARTNQSSGPRPGRKGLIARGSIGNMNSSSAAKRALRKSID